MQAKLAIGHLHDEDAAPFWMGNDKQHYTERKK